MFDFILFCAFFVYMGLGYALILSPIWVPIYLVRKLMK